LGEDAAGSGTTAGGPAYGFSVDDFPISDEHGRSLLSFHSIDGATTEDLMGFLPVDCSLVIVQWEGKVLFGFNVDRQLWELPGGTVESGESAHDAAVRELEEETGIRVGEVSLVARATFKFPGVVTRYSAAVFAVVLDSAPDLVESDELHRFTWWDPTGELFDGQGVLDAVAVRRGLLSR
jgi:8-oxo-dGTP diphosphatase